MPRRCAGKYPLLPVARIPSFRRGDFADFHQRFSLVRLSLIDHPRIVHYENYEKRFLKRMNDCYPEIAPAAPGIFPPVGGIRFIIGTYLPGDFIAPEPTPEMHLEDGDELGGANAGFHRTDTTDFGVVLSGNLALQLDDGAEVSLSPSDVLIENGTRHRWRVVGDAPATLASFIIGAQRR